MPGPTPEQLASSGSEAAHQTALFCWAALPDIKAKYPELEMMFHIPNGGTRNKIEAGHLKAQGVKPGIPDVFLPVARGAWYGFWIELKVGNNKCSGEQNEYQAKLRDQGYATAVAYNWKDAGDYLIYYLESSKNV